MLSFRDGGGLLPCPFALLDCLPQQIFDLTIDAAQFILGPGLQFDCQPGIDAEKKGFAFHDSTGQV